MLTILLSVTQTWILTNVTCAINDCLQLIANWIERNKLLKTMKMCETQMMKFMQECRQGSLAEMVNVHINGTAIPKQESIKYFGVTIDSDLS